MTTVTTPKFNSSPMKNDGWKTILSFWGPACFQGRTVKLREGNLPTRFHQVTSNRWDPNLLPRWPGQDQGEGRQTTKKVTGFEAVKKVDLTKAVT